MVIKEIVIYNLIIVLITYSRCINQNYQAENPTQSFSLLSFHYNAIFKITV